MNKVNVAEKSSLFSDYFSPKIAGELNGQQVKPVKFKGEFRSVLFSLCTEPAEVL